MRRTLALAAVLLVTRAAWSPAQIVRGVIRESASGLAIAGVVVSLDRVDSTAARADQFVAIQVLSNERGEYALRAPEAGRYFVTAKRIGAKRFLSEPFPLAAGETQRLDITLDAVLYTLPEVVVNASSLCATRRTSMQRLASLWDEARTALTASQITLRDSLFHSNVTRYVLTMDAEYLKVLAESRVQFEAEVSRPFSSLNSDSLGKVGFWRELPGDSAEFYGPDVEVLLSDTFRQQHCFSVVEGAQDRRGLVGLMFEPAYNRELPDVRGLLWLDGRTFELRFIEFGYTKLPAAEFMGRVGGEVHFARVPSGAWIVSRWSLRMPQYGRYVSGARALPKVLADVFNAAPPSVLRIVEEGAAVEAVGLHGPGTTSRITGTLLDSLGRPLAGGTVHVAGQGAGVAVDAQGRFRLDSLTAGTYSVIGEHPGYAAFGVPAASAFVGLGEAATSQVTLRAVRAREIIPKLCNGLPPVPPRGTLRLVLLERGADALVVGAPLVAAWVEPANDEAGRPARERTLRVTTDGNGAAVFCGLPPDVPIELSFARVGDDLVSIATLGLNRNQVLARMVRIALPR